MNAPLLPLVAALVRHYDELVDSLRRRFGDRALAHDIVHDACVRIMADPPQQPVHTPEAFLRRLTTHLAIDRYRVEAGRRAWVDSRAELPEVADPAGGPEAQLMFTQAVCALCDAVEALPPRCREVFILHKLHDIPQAEIAARLGISRNMVAQHMARAMRAVQPCLRQDRR